MTEWYYFKMFFKEVYWNRIKPIGRFFYDIWLRIRLSFMNQKQKNEWALREQEKSNKAITDIINGMMPLIVGAGVVGMTSSIINQTKKSTEPNKNLTQLKTKG